MAKKNTAAGVKKLAVKALLELDAHVNGKGSCYGEGVVDLLDVFKGLVSAEEECAGVQHIVGYVNGLLAAYKLAAIGTDWPGLDIEALCRRVQPQPKMPVKPLMKVVGDTGYELSAAFLAGAQGGLDGLHVFDCNPYRESDDRHQEWEDGHGLASEDDETGITQDEITVALRHLGLVLKAKSRR
jgi:hypothetical protein